jgi:glutamyl-tRNA synthetase
VSDSPDRPVRVRFAPSPTGSLHIGGLRTALFNWLFARHYGGTFILRIEDTDQKRFDPTALQTLNEALRWAGLQWDEGPEVGGPYGPYVQSERLDHYQKWAHWLVEHGKAYKCFCTPERLEQVREAQKAQGKPWGYDRYCRNLTAEEVQQREAEGQSYVIRFKMPLEGKLVVQDMIRGESEFDYSTQQDMILLKSDGFPTYHFAVVVDDHLMEISHVMRAVEWFPSLPLHVEIWKAFGWEMPQYGHLPVMLNPNGKGKMSKRHPPRDEQGHIVPQMVHDYMADGYLPEAVNNFLANIGWAFGDDREIFTMDEAIERFDGTRINPANGAFPVSKLYWINGMWIRQLPAEEIARRIKPYLEKAGLEVSNEVLLKAVPLIQERIKTLSEAVGWIDFFFEETIALDDPQQLIQKKMDAPTTVSALRAAYETLSEVNDFSHETQEAAMRALAERMGLKAGQLFGTLRVAVTGRDVSPPLFQTMEILGIETSLARIKAAGDMLEQFVKTLG